MVVAVVAVLAGGMDAHVSRTSVPLHQFAGEVTRQPRPLCGGKFLRQGNLELAGNGRVLARLGLLGSVPECRPVGGPLWRTGRQDKLGGFDATLAGVVVNLAGALVGDLHPGTIGRCRCRTATGRPAYRLDG